jgi:hypothetical protein
MTTIAKSAYKPAFLQRLFTGVYPPNVAPSPVDSGIFFIMFTNLNVFFTNPGDQDKKP